jgi:tight adherence protein B
MLKYVSIALFAAAVVLFVRSAYATIWTWWSKRIHTYSTWMAMEFESMFEEMTVEKARRFITIVIVSAAVFGYLLGGWFLAIILGVVGFLAPRGFVMMKRNRRLKTIDNQLVDALLLMSNALKSGLTLQQALELAARELKPPISDEIARIVKEIHLGRLTDDALRRFSERVPLPDVILTVDSILMLRETGGNLSETFDVIAHTVVERKKVEGKISAMTAQGMTQGVVMCLMPIVLMVLFSTLDATYMRPFFTHPIGWLLLILIFVLDGLGMWLMVKLVKVDV